MISIIIPVHNQLKHLNKCILSIKGRTSLTHEVIISDSNSTYPMNENYYQEALRQGLINKVIYDYHPGGFSRAINNGMKIVSDESDYIVWLNSDTIICTGNWLSKMVKPFELIEIVATGPISNSASYQTFTHCSEANCCKIASALNSFESRYPRTLLPNGFCVMIKRSAVEKTRPLDELNFPHYGSEDDYFLRMDGLKGIASDVFVYHHGKQSYREARKELTIKAVKKLHSKYENIYNDIMLTEISLGTEKDRVLKHILQSPDSDSFI